jgi:hypothetical protein
MNSFEQIFMQIQPQLQSLESLRIQQRKKNLILLLCWLGTVALAIIFGAVQIIEGFALFGIIALVFGIVALILGSSYTKKYKKTFKDVVIAPLVKAIDPELSYSKESYISREKYMESKIFLSNPDVYKGEDYVWGMVNKTMVEFSELFTQYKTHDSKGRTQYHTIFKGLFMIADFNKDFKGRTVVLPDYSEKAFGFIAKFFQKMNLLRDQLVYMEDPVFEKEFKVYSNDQIEARYILSTDMLSRIVELKRKMGRQVHLSFVNSKICIAISSNENLFDPKMSQSVIEPSMIRIFYDQILGCLQIIDDMNLNTRIWSKQ